MKRKIVLLLLLATVFFSCKAAKQTKAQAGVAEKEQHIPYKVDTVTARLELAPPEGYSEVVVEQMLVYVLTKDQPSVAFTTTDAKGESLLHRLTQLSNNESYSFGGGVFYELHKAEKGILTIYTIDQKPIPSRVIISGYLKK